MKIKHWIIKKLGGIPREYTDHYIINRISPTIHTVGASFTYDNVKGKPFPKDYLELKLIDNMAEELRKYMEITDGRKVGLGRAECRARLYVVMPKDIVGVSEEVDDE